ncbi:MAG: M24 family metallopeptidase, partial [Candidatus Ranarchaeia archaeon]
MLSEDASRKYKEAGRIASAVRREVKTLVKVGAPIIEICEAVEKNIKAKGGSLAFPCNVCVNEVAAHYSSPPEDEKVIPKDAIVKIDLGVHIDGYIADTATTISLNREYDGMVVAVEKALDQAIKWIRPNVSIRQLGEVIQKTIEQYGYKPIWNLTGHQMKKN